MNLLEGQHASPHFLFELKVRSRFNSAAHPPTTLERVTIFDPLLGAFCEYAVAHWDVEDWRTLGRETSTSEILSSHDRLYRSQHFGDDDYIDAARDVLPQILEEAVEPSTKARMAFVADYAPDLVTWLSDNGNYRTRKRFSAYLEEWASEIPTEWVGATVDVSQGTRAASKLRPSSVAVVEPVSPNWGTPTTPWSSSDSNWGIPAESVAVTPAPAPSSENPIEAAPTVAPESIFIVHGRELAAVREVQLFVLSVTGNMPQSLADQPGGGDTIIEKFEREAAASDYAIVLLTPDDEGRIRGNEGDMQPRARQNVILELGYFFGKLGRRKVLVLNAGVEQPSDVHGLSYIAYPGVSWKEDMRRELREAGFELIR